MERPGASERDERELARIVPALDGDDPEGMEHLGVHDLDRICRVDAAERPLGRGTVEIEATGERSRQSPEQEIRIGDRRLRAAIAVARRPGHGPGALGTDAQRSTCVPPDDRAASRADGVDVDHRQPDREAADAPLERALRPAADDQRHVGRRAPHVECDRVLDPRALRDKPRSNGPAAGPETSTRAGCAAASSASTTPPDDRITSGSGSPAARHDSERAEVPAAGWPEVGVGRNRRGSLVLAELGRDLVRRDDVGRG